MRIIGKRKVRPISEKPSGFLLKQGATFNDELHCLPTGNMAFFPKGIYRYSTFEEANEHWESCMIEIIVKNARK